MPIKLELSLWMVERIVQILSDHEYTGTDEIVQTIKEQAENQCEKKEIPLCSNSQSNP